MTWPPPPPLAWVLPPPPTPTPAELGPGEALWCAWWGPELAPRGGAWGQLRLEGLWPIPEAWKAELKQARLLFLSGGPWPGQAGDGGAWAEGWASQWRARTGGQALALRPSQGGSWPDLDPEGLALRARTALASMPPGPTFLVGHSAGARWATTLAEALRAQGQRVQGVVMWEVQAPHTGCFAPEAPKGVPRLLWGENQWQRLPPPCTGQRRLVLWSPGRPHMDWVLRPDPRQWLALEALAGSPIWPPKAHWQEGP